MVGQKTPWAGEIPDRCDVCNRPFSECINPNNSESHGKTFIDGRMITGQWANMGENCFAVVGVGLGVGKGQRYNATTGDKIEG